MIFCILQDRHGFMWFGTMYGLVKYDGDRYKVYRHDPNNPHSISHDDIISLFEDSQGNIWVGTWGGGLNKMNPHNGKFTRFLHSPNNPSSLSHNNVWDIQEIMDQRDSSLWVATNAGLDRLDHYKEITPGTKSEDTSSRTTPIAEKFIHYRHNPDDPQSLAGNFVRTLYADRHNTLWVGTSGGMSKLTAAKREIEDFVNYRHHSQDPYSLPGNEILFIYEDADLNLWISVAGKGLAVMPRRHRGEGRFSKRFLHHAEVPNSLAGNTVHFVHEDRKGDYWIGTNNGLCRLDGGKAFLSGGFTHFEHDPQNPHSISSNSVITVCEDRSGNLWFGTYHGGLDKLVKGREKFRYLRHHPFNENSLASNRISSIFEDREGILWVGTNGQGLNRIIPVEENRQSAADTLNKNAQLFSLTTQFMYKHYFHQPDTPQSLPGNRISAIVGSDYRRGNPGSLRDPTHRPDTLWIGTRRNGLIRVIQTISGELSFRKYTHHPRNSNSLSSNHVTTLLIDHENIIWIGSVNGLNRFNPRTQQFTRYKPDPDDQHSLTHPWVLTIYEDSKENLWIGTYGGLSMLDRSLDHFINYRHHLYDPHSLSNNYVYAIHETQNGDIWVGTSNGLNRFNQDDGTFSTFGESDGLPNGVICGILEDEEGNLWISTHKGISKFNPLASAEKRFRNYDIVDGLQSNIYYPGSYFQNTRGEMFFGGIDGLNIFHPSKIAHNSYVPPVIITGIRVFNEAIHFEKPLNALTEIELSHDENWLTFQFAALDYTAPQKNQYAYRLKDVDSDWQYCGNRNMATYTDLGPGEYIFMVKGSNNDGFWNEEGVALNVHILPPFWQTSYFYGALGGLLVFLAFGIHHYRLRHKLRQSIMIEKTREREREWVREKTARDYHDELGHQLTKISLFSELLRRDLGATEGHQDTGNGVIGMNAPQVLNSLDSPKLMEYISKISRASNQLCNNSRDFIWALNPEKDSLYELALYIQSFGGDFFDDTGIEFQARGITFEMDNIKLSMDWRRHLIFIIKEGMNNILKHSGAKNADLQFMISDGHIKIVLSDDGCGFPIGVDQKGNGLRIMEKRAMQINGKVSFQSHPETGTRVEFSGKLPQHSNP